MDFVGGGAEMVDFAGVGDLRNERTTVRVEVKNSFIVKVFIFRYIYLQELISTVTSENFY